MLLSASVKISSVKDALAALLKDYEVAAPVSDGANLLYSYITDPNDVVFSDQLPYKSPKEFLLPQTEKILAFGEDSAEDIQEAKKTVIFDVRPCDLSAFKRITDKVFSEGKFKDGFYMRRRKASATIGMACKSLKPGCFCNLRGIDKSYSTECDIFLTPAGEDEYIAAAHTPVGCDLLKSCFRSVPAAFSPEPAELSETLEICSEEKDVFEKVNWDAMSASCISCGTCTFVCPACHCFDFKDKGSVRYRVWDSCMYSAFTLHASGHNPRAGKPERFRQRFMHKYVYMLKNIGESACFGCGRCTRKCPAGINARRVLECIKAEAAGGSDG
ncbi:MAG: 4Fe-4S dicluster domain-containing protein [Clostridiales bacterium]|nr:4Fe-4S dicluster domain-containing protein [Clostridiales bacterium]